MKKKIYNRMLYHYDLTPVKEIETFDGEKYDPNFCTPLYDAIGFLVTINTAFLITPLRKVWKTLMSNITRKTAKRVPQ